MNGEKIKKKTCSNPVLSISFTSLIVKYTEKPMFFFTNNKDKNALRSFLLPPTENSRFSETVLHREIRNEEKV